MAGLAVGAKARGTHCPPAVAFCDVLLARPSRRVHSNGSSLVRRIEADQRLISNSPVPFRTGPLGAALLTLTALYVKASLAALKTGGDHGVAHITGGGLTQNRPRVSPQDLGATKDSQRIPALPRMASLALPGRKSGAKMLKTFN